MHTATKSNTNEFEIIELKNQIVSAKIVVNIGNTLFSHRRASEEKLYFPFTLNEYKNNKKLAGNPFMHPWANRLEEDAITIQHKKKYFPEEQKQLIYRDRNSLPLHGLLLKTDAWKTIELYADETTCFHSATLVFDKKEWLDVFPFSHEIKIKHQLKENELSIQTTLINLDEYAMPVSFGFHPYFLIDQKNRKDYFLTIPAKQIVETDTNMIPNGIYSPKENKWNFSGNIISLKDVSLDDGFKDLEFNTEGKATFRLNDINIHFYDNFQIAQVYAPVQNDKPYVCIEPMTAITNALNTNSFSVIKKNEHFSATFTIAL